MLSSVNTKIFFLTFYFFCQLPPHCFAPHYGKIPEQVFVVRLRFLTFHSPVCPFQSAFCYSPSMKPPSSRRSVMSKCVVSSQTLLIWSFNSIWHRFCCLWHFATWFPGYNPLSWFSCVISSYTSLLVPLFLPDSFLPTLLWWFNLVASL